MLKIFIIESGFVYIGTGERIKDQLLGESIKIKKASNIRRWGTDKNIGQLAIEGKKENTVLDYTGTITVPVSKIINTIDVLPGAAKTFLDEK